MNLGKTNRLTKNVVQFHIRASSRQSVHARLVSDASMTSSLSSYHKSVLILSSDIVRLYISDVMIMMMIKKHYIAPFPGA